MCYTCFVSLLKERDFKLSRKSKKFDEESEIPKALRKRKNYEDDDDLPKAVKRNNVQDKPYKNPKAAPDKLPLTHPYASVSPHHRLLENR